jgi:single-strand DNA-binding protein
MASLNNCQFIGRLGRDPEKRFSNNEKEISTFSIAVDTGFGDNKTTEWLNITAFGKTAEFANKYLGKGRLVFVQGSLRIEKYEGKDGTEKTAVKIYANQIQGLDSAKDGNGNGGSKSSRKQEEEDDTDDPMPW